MILDEKIIASQNLYSSIHNSTPKDIMQTIYLAGGCFWGVQAYFDLLNGVEQTSVGYANSLIPSPSYQEVCSGKTNATEAVEIIFNPNVITLHEILLRFFSIIDPTALNFQGNDRGTQYRSGIYAHQAKILKQAQYFIIKEVQPHFHQSIVTEVIKLQNFYKAEYYHQKYLEKNPNGYCHIDLRLALQPVK